MNADITLNLLTIVFLVLANAFFVGAEFALVRVRRTRIQELIGEGSSAAKVVSDAIDHLDDYISATQVGITLASLALGWLGEPFLAGLLHPALTAVMPEAVAQASAHGIAFGVAFFIITFMHVVIGELLPKSLALQFPEKMALYIARPMRFCALLFRPLIWILNGSSNRLLKMMGIKPALPHSLALSEEELLMLLTESSKAGVVTEDERRMLQRVFKFHDKTVREIMIPRPDIIALELRSSEEQIQAAFRQGYSRLPVYDGTLNNVKGIVYVKDLIYAMRDPKLIKLVDLLREAIFVPETKEVSILLREFQKNKMHMAIVIDEFGDTAGLVTLEDVIEEIVGEIQDEYDYEPAQVERAPDGSMVFDGKTSLDRFREIFPNVELPEGSFETVAGLVFQLAGRVPKETDVLRHGALSLKVLKREGRRLRKIGVRLEGAAPAAPASAEAPQVAESAAVAADPPPAEEGAPPMVSHEQAAVEAEAQPIGDQPPPEESAAPRENVRGASRPGAPTGR